MVAGEWEIVPLLDAEGSFVSVADGFPGASTETLERARAVAPAYYRDDGKWWVPFHAFLLRGPALLVVDAGVGPASPEFLGHANAHLPQELERAGVDPADVETLFLTHLHVDHVGWADIFTSAQAYVHRADWEHYDRPPTRAKFKPFTDDDRLTLLDGDAEIAPGVCAVETRGHTPGHMSLEVGETFVFGDVAVDVMQLIDPDLVFASGDEDGAAAAATRRATLERLADEGTRVASPHLPGVFGRVERDGRAFAWRADGSA